MFVHVKAMERQSSNAMILAVVDDVNMENWTWGKPRFFVVPGRSRKTMENSVTLANLTAGILYVRGEISTSAARLSCVLHVENIELARSRQTELKTHLLRTMTPDTISILPSTASNNQVPPFWANWASGSSHFTGRLGG